MSGTRKTAFISSTAIDLPEHREKVIQACIERGCFPDGMENWPAADADAMSLCLGKVDQADIFVGIYAHRYGWIPPGQTKSITELEYNRAVERGIPRLMFLMGAKHPVFAGDVETGPGAEALKQFKQRIESDRVRASFDNSDQLRAELLHALGESVAQTVENDLPKINLAHLPAGAEHFFGRDDELAALDAAWADGGKTHIVELIAPGGVGKTALLKRWLALMLADNWRGARRVYGWSFYSQGTDARRQASEDSFLSEALQWFGVAHDPAINPWDKGRKLAEAVIASRTLLVLDGVEPLQYPPGPMAGKLHAPGVEALLQQIASAGHAGLCLISSRVALTNLAEYERADEHPAGAVVRCDLGNLADADGAQLLHKLGANKAGVVTIASDDEELKQACREVRGHGLTLSLLGRYLALAYAGDIRQRGQVKFEEADTEVLGGHAFKVVSAYEIWFAQDKKGERELAAMRLFGFFDRPASRDSLRALRKAPAILGLTRPLVTLTGAQWQTTLSRLEACGLIYPSKDKTTIDAHPLVREYLAKTLREDQPEAWREGHKRLYEQLKDSVPHRPSGLPGLQPLYQAVVHGCLAGLYQETCAEVYVDRILRGMKHDGFYSVNKLGAFGSDLGALTCFFDERWRVPAPAFAEEERAWLLGEAGFRLRALGRLDEAEEPMRTGAEMTAKLKDWMNAAITYGNLSQLQSSLGRTTVALADAERSVKYTEHSDDHFQCSRSRATLADALHQHGNKEAAAAQFLDAETMQAKQKDNFPLLYSLSGFLYCDLLLAETERAAWRGQGNATLIERCADVTARGQKMFEWRVPYDPLLDIALDHLTLGRCALYRAVLEGQSPLAAEADVNRAVDGLRAAGQQDDIPRGLLTRAWLRHRLNNPSGAKSDLDDAWQIAARGNMRLHMADIHLTRARLFGDRAELAKARSLIVECGYGRRLPELEDAEAALGVTP